MSVPGIDKDPQPVLSMHSTSMLLHTIQWQYNSELYINVKAFYCFIVEVFDLVLW